MNKPVTFNEALLDAKGDDDLMPTIEKGLRDVQNAVDNIETDLADSDSVLSMGDPVGTITAYGKDLISAAQALEQYEPYLEHYDALREHF